MGNFKVFHQLLLDPLPKTIALELTTVCNYSCPMCRQNKNPPKPKWAKPELIDQLVPVLSRPEFDSLLMVGLGENFLHPQMPVFLDRLLAFDKSLFIITNGTHLKPEFIDSMLGHKVTLRLSMDSATEKTYQIMRHPENWGLLLSRLAMIEEKKRALGVATPTLSLSMALNRLTAEDLKQLPRFCEEHHIPFVTVNWVLSYEEAMFQHSFWHDPVAANELLDFVRQDFIQRGISADLPKNFKLEGTRMSATTPLDHFWDSPRAPQGCLDLHRPWICADGTVAACCISYINVGNLYQNSFEDIWHGPHYAQIIEGFEKRHPLEACRECSAILPVESIGAHKISPKAAQQPERVDVSLAQKVENPYLKEVQDFFSAGLKALKERAWLGAIGFFHQALALHPWRIEIMNNLAASYALGGQVEKAKNIFLKAHEKTCGRNPILSHNVQAFFQD